MDGKMEELTLEDLLHPAIELIESSLLGKRVFLRKMSFDSQMALAKSTTEGEDDRAKEILAITLCDKDGQLIFESIDQAVQALGKLDAADVMAVFDVVPGDDTPSVDAAEKN